MSEEPTAGAAPAPASSNTGTAAPKSVATSAKDYFKVILDTALKPITSFKENLPKFSDVKSAGILALIIVAAMTILSTITSVVGIVRTQECVENCGGSYSKALRSLGISSSSDEKEKIETKWNWDNLKDYDWFKNVGYTFLGNVLTVAILAGAYFGMSKAFKSSSANFFRMVSVAALGLVPSAIAAFIAPIIGGINLTVGGIVAIAGTVYSLSIIFVGLNLESGVEGDKKVYLNIAAIACMFVAYYIVIRFMMGEAGGLMFKSLIQAPVSGGSSLFSGLLSSGASSSSTSIDLNDLF